MSNITPPIARIPIGIVQINGKPIDVQQHPEFIRFFFDLFTRVGGVTGVGNDDLLLELMNGSPSDTGAAEALRAVDELRNEVAALRGSNDALRGQLQDLQAQIESQPTFQPLQVRIQQIEDRLQ